MLKNRSKTFAPKKIGVRKPGAPSSTPSSTRPSTEPRSQSHTPVPTQLRLESTVTDPNAVSGSSAGVPALNVDATLLQISQEQAEVQPVIQLQVRHTPDDNDSANQREIDGLTSQIQAETPASHSNRLMISTAEGTSTPSTSQDSQQRPNKDSGSQHEQRQDNGIASNSSKRKAMVDEGSEFSRKKVHQEPAKQLSAHGASSSSSRNLARTILPAINLPIQTTMTPQILPSIETLLDGANPSFSSTQSKPRSDATLLNDTRNLVSESRIATSEASRRRYPSPENMIPLADRAVLVSPGQTGTRTPDSRADVAIASGAGGTSVNPATESYPNGSSTHVPATDANPAIANTVKKTPTKKKKVVVGRSGDQANIDQVAATGSKRRRGRARKEKQGRRIRDETPEGAEEETIEHKTTTMGDLCGDIKIGRRSIRHDEIKERVQRQKAKIRESARLRKYQKLHPELLISNVNPEGSEHEGAGTSSLGISNVIVTRDGEERPTVVTLESRSGLGPQMRVVDGHLVLDESSLQIDRHKRNQIDDSTTKTVIENDFTTLITSNTHLKRERAQQWDDAAMDLFYRGLRMFGTDFQMIAQLFPNRNRRQVKLRFTAEEKVNPHRITRALTGIKEPIDLDEFRRYSNVKLDPLEVIQAEQAKLDADQKALIQQADAEKAEETRQKRLTIHAGKSAAAEVLARVELSDEEDQPGGSAKENSDPKGRGKGRTKAKGKANQVPRNKNRHSMHGGGEEVIVDGRID